MSEAGKTTFSFSIPLPKYIIVAAVFLHMCMGYLWGMLFSAHIFANIDETHWHNAWVYFWLFLWPSALAYFFFLYIGGFFLCLGLLYLGYQKFFGRRVLIWRQGRMRDKIMRQRGQPR